MHGWRPLRIVQLNMVRVGQERRWIRHVFKHVRCECFGIIFRVLRRVLAYPREKASRAFLDLFENVVPAHGFEAGRAGVIEAGRAGVNDEEFLLRVWEGVTHGVWRQ